MSLNNEQFDEDLKALKSRRGKSKHNFSKKTNHLWWEDKNQTYRKKESTGYVSKKQVTTKAADSFAEYVKKYLNNE